MVLRILPLIFLLSLSLSTTSFARRVSPSQKKAFARAKTLFKRNLFGPTIHTLKSSFSLKSRNTPPGALILAAYSYEKLGKWSQVVKTYNLLIRATYNRKNRKIIRRFLKKGADNLPKAPKKLYRYYHRLAESMLQFYLHNRKKLSTKQRKKLHKRVAMYVEILSDSDYEDDSYDTIMERFEQYDKYIAQTLYHSNWFVSASYISFRNQLSLQRQGDGLVIPITSTAEGTCLGGGWRYQNAFWEYSINGCFSSASMNVSADANSSIAYKQSEVPGLLLMLGPSVLWKPSSGDFSIGINLPFIYNYGGYTVPTGYDINNQTLLTYGYFLESNWKLPKWGFFTKLGKAAKFKSTIWVLGISYNL